MMETIANILFVGISLVFTVMMVLWYVAQGEKKFSYPYNESVAGWIILSFISPIRSAVTLYGQDTSISKKDFYGMMIFSITFFTLINFVYFRGHLENGGVLLTAVTLFILFFSFRQYFTIRFIYRHKSLIEALRENYQQVKKETREIEKLRNSIMHLNKRGRWVEKVFLKWKGPYERLLEKQEDIEWSIEERRDYLNEQLRTLTYNMEQLTALEPDTILALDSNILMKADDYIIKEIQKFPILISKRVQQEWDKNKTSDNPKKGYRARQAIRRLMELPNFEFTVSKWQDSYLKNNNLLKGNPDDEIIADYLYETQQGKHIVVLSDDLNFQASAKVHMPIIKLKRLDTFS